MWNGQRLAIHFIGQNGLRMRREFHIEYFIEGLIERLGKLCLDRFLPHLIGGEDDVSRSRHQLAQLENLGQRDSAPFGYARPSLDAVMQRDLRLFGQLAQILQGEFHGLFDKAIDLKLVILEIILGQLFILPGFRWVAVHPEVGRNIGFFIVLLRLPPLQDQSFYRVRESAQEALRGSSFTQGIPRGPDIHGSYKQQRDDGYDDGGPEAGIGSAKHTIANVVLEMDNEDQRRMHDNKEEKC